jgi:hypothetical protein
MAVLVVICFAVAALAAAGAAFYAPPAPPRYNLLGVAVFFIALGLALQAWGGTGG